MRRGDPAPDLVERATSAISQTGLVRIHKGEMMSRIFAVISLVAILAACTRGNDVNARFAPARQPFPEFRLNSLDGSDLDSKELRGKVALINFWASWCGPCRMETPWLVELKKEYDDSGFEIVGIAIDPEDEEEIREFVRDLNVNYPVVYSDQKVEGQVGILGTPTSFLLDRHGNVAHKHVGVVAKEVLAGEIETLLE